MPGESADWAYDAFLSYSTEPDLALAHRLQVLLEGIHEQPGLKEHRLKPLKIWRDQSGYRQRRVAAGSREAGNAAQPTPIETGLSGQLALCRSLLILWPGRSKASAYMQWELEEFLAQNQLYGWTRNIYLAVTQGMNPAKARDRFFSPRHLEIGLLGEVFFDFREQHDAARTWKKVRDYESEALRLAIELANPVDEDGQSLTVGDLYPGWQREQERQRQRDAELRRKALARKAAIAGNLIRQSPVTALALAEAVWTSVQTHESRKALAGVLCATQTLHTHLLLGEAHAGVVQDHAFLGNDRLLSLDSGSGAIGDSRRGALCVWDLARTTLYHRDERLGGNRLLVTGADRIVVVGDTVLQALRWCDDEERVRFRARWSCDLVGTGAIADLAYEPRDDLIAAARGDWLTILRDGDRVLIHQWQAPGKIRALSWCGPRILAMGTDESMIMLDLERGSLTQLPIPGSVESCAFGPGGLAVLTPGKVSIVREDGIAAHWSIPLRDMTATLRWAGDRLFVAGGGGNTGEPGLISVCPEDGASQVLYQDYEVGLRSLAVSPDGRRLAAARSSDSRDPEQSPRVLPLWDLSAWNPLPNWGLELKEDIELACPRPGTSGFATVAGGTLTARAADGARDWDCVFDREIAALADSPQLETLVVAIGAAEIVLVSAAHGEIVQRWADEARANDDIVFLSATAGGARLLVGWRSGQVLLLDSASLQPLGAVERHRYELVGSITDAQHTDAVMAKGGAAWVNSPWVILQPANAAAPPHPVDEAGVKQVKLDLERPHVGGWGWWDTRTDTVVWSLAGCLGHGEAALIGMDAGTLFSPAIEGGLGVTGYSLGPATDDPPQPPTVSVSVHHPLPDPAIELLARSDGSLVVAHAFNELLIFSRDEAEPVARVPVPDGFRALTLTGDGALIIAKVDEQVVALSLDPERWAQEAHRRAGRGLTEGERRIYLGEIESLMGTDRGQAAPPTRDL